MQRNNTTCDYFFTELKIDYFQFRELWIDALKKRDDFRALFLFLKDFVDHLASVLESKKPNSYLSAILRMVDSIDQEKSLAKFNFWLDSKDIKSEINYIIIKRIHRITKIPYQASPRMAFYYFTKDLKYELVKQIQKNKDFINPRVDVTESYVMELDPIATFNNWEKYLCTLYIRGYNKKEIAQITNLSRQTIYIEEKKLCRYLKKKQLKT
tara:strand:+ start:2839 stop:3471 length:633 start_codon:yes stop_codon:yes gene_type:complete